MKKNKLFWILTVGCVLNFAAHLYFYPSLPDIVPTHWGASGQVNVAEFGIRGEDHGVSPVTHPGSGDTAFSFTYDL